MFLSVSLWLALFTIGPIWDVSAVDASLLETVPVSRELQDVDVGGDKYKYIFETYDENRQAYVSTEGMKCIASALANNTATLVDQYIDLQTNTDSDWGREVVKVAHNSKTRRVILTINGEEHEFEVWEIGFGNKLVLNPDTNSGNAEPPPPPVQGGVGGWVRRYLREDKEKVNTGELVNVDDKLGSAIKTHADGEGEAERNLAETTTQTAKRRKRRKKRKPRARNKRRRWKAAYQITNICRHCPSDNSDNGRRMETIFHRDFEMWMNDAMTPIVKTSCPEANAKFTATEFKVV